MIDTGLLTKDPVDLDKLSKRYIVGLHTATRTSRIYKENDTIPKCPGKACPFNKAFTPDQSKWKLQTRPYPMLDEMIAPEGQGGTAFFRIESTVPLFASKKGTLIAFDALGFNADSYRFFVNGVLAGEGEGGLLKKSITFPSPGGQATESLVLGLELKIGKFIAPGIHPVSQPFLSTPNLSPLIRNSYRSFDKSVVIPVSYMFCVFALLAGLGCLFTPFYREIFYFSLALNFWNVRHLMANLIITPPSFFTHDFVVVDACLKIGLYGSLVTFFALYFRQHAKLAKYGKYIYIVLAGVCILGAGTKLFPELSIWIVRSQSLLVSVVLLYGSAVSFATWKTIKSNARARFRAGISITFAAYTCFAGLAFGIRYITTTFGFKEFEVLNSLAVRQVYGSWMIILCIALGLAIALEWALVVKDRQKIMQRFGMVVDRRIVNEVAHTLKLTSRRIDSAVAMFIDLRSFTKICETETPQAVISALNTYLDIVTESVQAHGGIVDKFVGDGVMALWGVPEPMEEAALKAATASISIREEVAKANVLRKQRGEFELSFGIGLHIGSVIFGPVGTKERIDYTAIGPTVNVASRIQGLTKRFDCDILMSKDFQSKIPPMVKVESGGKTEVRGLASEIEVFKLSSSDTYLRDIILQQEVPVVSLHQSLIKKMKKDRSSNRKAA